MNAVRWGKSVADRGLSILGYLGLLFGVVLVIWPSLSGGHLPLAQRLLILAVLVSLVLSHGAYLTWKEDVAKSGYDQNAQLIPVVGKQFKNERVVLDGYSYSACRFDSVTFVVLGKAPCTINGCTISNPHFDFTASPGASIAVNLLSSLGALEGLRIDHMPSKDFEPLEFTVETTVKTRSDDTDEPSEPPNAPSTP